MLKSNIYIVLFGMLDNQMHVAKWCPILIVEPEVQGLSLLGGEACYIFFIDN